MENYVLEETNSTEILNKEYVSPNKSKLLLIIIPVVLLNVILLSIVFAILLPEALNRLFFEHETVIIARDYIHTNDSIRQIVGEINDVRLQSIYRNIHNGVSTADIIFWVHGSRYTIRIRVILYRDQNDWIVGELFAAG